VAYRWTPALRDALIGCEFKEMPGTFGVDDYEDMARYVIASMTALTSIPLNSTLEPTGDEVEVDGDVEPAPTWEWVDQLVQYYYGNSPTVLALQVDRTEEDG